MTRFRFRRVRPLGPHWRKEDAGPLVVASSEQEPDRVIDFRGSAYPEDAVGRDRNPELFMPYPKAEPGPLLSGNWFARPGSAGAPLTAFVEAGRYLIWLVPGLTLLMHNALVPVLLLAALCLFWAGCLAQLRINRSQSVAIHSRLWDRLLDLSADRLGGPAHRAANRITEGLGAALDRAALRSRLRGPGTLIIFSLLLACFADVRLSITLFIAATASGAASFALEQKLSGHRRIANRLSADLSHTRAWVLGHIIELRALQVASRHLQNLSTLTESWLDEARKVNLARLATRVCLGGALCFGTAAIGFSWMATGVPAGNALAVLLFGVPAIYAASNIGQVAGRVWSSRAALEGVAPIAHADLADVAPDTPARIERIELREIGFAHSPAAPVLQNVSLTLAPGDVLALEGPSGGGKSTLLRLLMGLVAPTSGELVVNDGALSCDTAAYRRQVAAVFQDQELGFSTIRNAVLQDTPGADLAKAWHALHLVGLGEAVGAMPMGIQTLLVAGAFPFALTRQVLIARALLQKSDLLILDEALSALDLATARTIIAAARAQGSIVVYSTHRPDLAALADRVMTLGVPQADA